MSDEDWNAIIRDPAHPDYEHYRQDVKNEVGPDAMLEFDPEHDFFAHKNFNSGVFANRRLGVIRKDVPGRKAALVVAGPQENG